MPGSMITLGIVLAAIGLIEGWDILLIIAGILLAIGIPLAIIKVKAENKELEQRINQKNKLNFYNECLANNIKNINTDREQQKAELIAQKYNLPFAEIKNLFEEARLIALKEEEQEKQKKLQALTETETLRCALLDKYSDLSGRDKRIAMLNDELQEALTLAKQLSDGSVDVLLSTQQKEEEWAIHGGIASGIAGAGAGMATALDIQARNAEIRTQNQANIQTFMPLAMKSFNDSKKASQHAAELKEKLENARTRLVFEDDAATCLSRLKFENTTVEVSETGTCTVSTDAFMPGFFEMKIVVDGTILANIFDDRTLIGTAMLVLPRDGVSSRITLRGMCLFCGKPGKTYRVEFDAENLWTMER